MHKNVLKPLKRVQGINKILVIIHTERKPQPCIFKDSLISGTNSFFNFFLLILLGLSSWFFTWTWAMRGWFSGTKGKGGKKSVKESPSPHLPKETLTKQTKKPNQTIALQCAHGPPKWATVGAEVLFTVVNTSSKAVDGVVRVRWESRGSRQLRV